MVGQGASPSDNRDCQEVRHPSATRAFRTSTRSCMTYDKGPNRQWPDGAPTRPLPLRQTFVPIVSYDRWPVHQRGTSTPRPPSAARSPRPAASGGARVDTADKGQRGSSWIGPQRSARGHGATSAEDHVITVVWMTSTPATELPCTGRYHTTPTTVTPRWGTAPKCKVPPRGGNVPWGARWRRLLRWYAS